MGAYKKCPRCDLNWIKQDEDYCPVCKAELKMKGGIHLLEDDENTEEERVCPICHINLLEEGEDCCPQCKAERENVAEDSTAETDPDTDESWKDYVDVDDEGEDVKLDESDEISLAELEESEKEYDDDEPDDFDESISFSNSDDDFDDDEEEEEHSDGDLDIRLGILTSHTQQDIVIYPTGGFLYEF